MATASLAVSLTLLITRDAREGVADLALGALAAGVADFAKLGFTVFGAA